MYLYFMFVNPLSHDPWRDSILIGLLSVSICILGSPENLHVPQQQYNITGSVPFQLNVPQGHVHLPQQSQHDPFKVEFPI